MASQRRALLPLLVLALAAWTTYQFAFAAGGAPAGLRGAAATRGVAKQGLARTPLLARGGAEATDDSVELGGFSGFVVGLALLPHVLYALNIAFNVAIGTYGFGLGPYGLELVSCAVALGLTVWSLGSFVQRGRGLPAGPLGFLGLAEGLSYLAVLGLVIATIASSVRSGPAPSFPSVSLPAVSMPKFEAPSMLQNSAPSLKNIELPKFEAPKINMPKFDAPKMPDMPKFDAPKFEAPNFKLPDAPKFEMPKIPDIKVPEMPKMPEAKAPEPEKPKPKAPEPEKKAAPEKKAPKPAAKGPDYDMLFD